MTCRKLASENFRGGIYDFRGGNFLPLKALDKTLHIGEIVIACPTIDNRSTGIGNTPIYGVHAGFTYLTYFNSVFQLSTVEKQLIYEERGCVI